MVDIKEIEALVQLHFFCLEASLFISVWSMVLCAGVAFNLFGDYNDPGVREARKEARDRWAKRWLIASCVVIPLYILLRVYDVLPRPY